MSTPSASQRRAAEFHELVENHLQIERGAADGFEHLRGCNLLLQRLVKLARETLDVRFLPGFAEIAPFVASMPGFALLLPAYRFERLPWTAF